MVTNLDTNKRIEFLDIAKGIGIILVVWAHAGGPFSPQIDLFHMPLFFLISGFLYNPKTPVKEFVIRKFKSLYIPFAFWNLLFYLMMGLYFAASLKSLTIGSIKILLTLSKEGQFLGATWFLGSLFVITVSYKLFDVGIPKSKFKDIIVLGLFTSFALIGFLVTFPYMFSRTLILGFFFAFGSFIKKYIDRYRIFDCKLIAIICAIIFFVLGNFVSVNLGENYFNYPVLFVISAFMASYSILCFCQFLDNVKHSWGKRLKKGLTFLGRRSIDIVIWHFVFFRIGIIAQMGFNDEKITVSNILSYYPIYDAGHGWWMIYLLIGLFVPLFWCWLLRIGFWGKRFKKI